MNSESVLAIVMIVYLAILGFSVTFPLILWGISYKVHEENRPLMANGLNVLQNNWGGPIAVTATLGGIWFALYLAYIFMSIIVEVTSSITATAASMLTMMDSTSGIVIGIIVGILIFAISIFVSVILPVIIAGPSTAGAMEYFLTFTRTGKAQYADMFSSFRNKIQFQRSSQALFFMALFYSLWYLLFIIPGIIAIYSYSLTFFIMADEPHLSALEAIAKSKKMMRGRKAQLFWLQLRFTGWHYVAGFSGGVGYLWLGPYMATTTASFYESIMSSRNGSHNYLNS